MWRRTIQGKNVKVEKTPARNFHFFGMKIEVINSTHPSRAPVRHQIDVKKKICDSCEPKKCEKTIFLGTGITKTAKAGTAIFYNKFLLIFVKNCEKPMVR